MSARGLKPFEKAEFLFAFCLLALMIVRLASVIISPLQLGPDEAQYWRWGQSFEWGYYSKPPMTAWLIGISSGLFGDHEWAIRLSPPIFHTGTAFLLFLTGRQIWSSSVGILAGACWAMMGGVWLSSTIMSTDVALLFFWSLGLWFFLAMRDQNTAAKAIGLGVALGLGFLSKYAMIYFLIGLALAAMIDRPARQALLSRNGAIATGLFLLIFSPHLIWNAQNGFKTVSHTADNANWGGDQSLLNPENALKFVGDQFGVFAPVHFFLLLVLFGVILLGRSRFIREDKTARLLLAFILPPLLIITVQAFISRAHANWAATAYPAACLLIAAWSVYAKGWVRLAMIGGLVINLGFGIFFTTAISQSFQTQFAWGGESLSKRVRGWPETVEAIAGKVEELGATSIITDEREIWHGLDYYGRHGEIAVPVRGWRTQGTPKSASEEVPITEADAKNALILNTRKGQREKLLADFETVTPAGELNIDMGAGRYRRFTLFLATGFDPKPRGAEE